MPQYTVISDRILTGTISDLPLATRFAWLVILFEAEKLRGRVKLPVRDLAKRASISTDDAIEALRLLQQPDPLSSSKAYSGRRLIPLPNEGEDWYRVVTWEKHAEEREIFFRRLRQYRLDSKKRSEKLTVSQPERKDV